MYQNIDFQLVSEKKSWRSRKQKTLQINSYSVDTAKVPRQSKSTHHHECKPKQKQTKVGITSEKPNSTGKFANRNHLQEQKVQLKKSHSSRIYRRSRQKTDLKKYHSNLGLYFKAVMIFKTRSASVSSIIKTPTKYKITSQSKAWACILIQSKIHI